MFSLAPLLVTLLAADPVAPEPPKALRRAVAPAPSSAEVRTRIETYLESKEAPISPEEWRALGPEGARVLEEIALDAKKLPTRRARAVAALAVVGSPRAPRLMIDLARREGEKPIVRMSALQGAGALMEAPALLSAVKPILASARDTHVRAAAADVLVRKDARTGCPVVRTQSAREKVEARPAFQRVLTACDGDAIKPQSHRGVTP